MFSFTIDPVPCPGCCPGRVLKHCQYLACSTAFSSNKQTMPSIKSDLYRSNGGGDSTPQKRRLRSNSSVIDSPIATKSPRKGLNSSPKDSDNVNERDNVEGCKLATKKLCDSFVEKSNWNPSDMERVSAAKEALHVSTAPATVVCRANELNRILEFCKACVEQGKAGSLYVSGCPGTGKSMSMEKVKQNLLDWSKQAGFQPPDMLTMNCTSLTKTSEIFNKLIGNNQPDRKAKGSTSPLQYLQNSFSQQQSSGKKMMLVIADELDYLITKDRAVLHDLFMLTTFPFSRCILIGIANSIDLADRFLPRLQSLNCKPMVITFRAYSKDQILQILQERLMVLSQKVFHPLALELCARKVAAASGDMRKALCICRSAIEALEAELRETSSDMNKYSAENDLPHQQTAPENNIVRIDHMAIALSKAFRSPVVDTIQSLPQHQQIILCSAVKFFRGGKKDTSVGELNKSYVGNCKSTMIPPVGTMEFLSMCRVLQDQGLLKLGQSRDDKLRRVALKVDEADITFALQGVRFFRNCLQ